MSCESGINIFITAAPVEIHKFFLFFLGGEGGEGGIKGDEVGLSLYLKSPSCKITFVYVCSGL